MTQEGTNSAEKSAVSDPPIGLGIIGLGMAGAVMVHAAARHSGFVLRAAADPHAGPREAFARDFNASAYADAAELCADPAVEVVYIATPHQFHAPHAIMAAEHGKHVILEKPMALTLADCDAMIAAAREAGIALVVGHSHSFDPNAVEIARLVASGAYGRLAMINMWNYNDFLYRPRRPEELDTAKGGGIVYNQLPHQIDTARLIAASRVRSVRAHTTALDPARPTEGGCIVFLAFENGAAASLIYSGYDHFDSDEFHSWIGEGGATKQPAHGRTRRSLAEATRGQAEAELKSERYGYGSPLWRAAAPAGGAHQQHFGVLIATCERADLKPSADGVLVYGHDGAAERPLSANAGVSGHGNVVNELAQAIRDGGPALHDGVWGRHTLEICLAILQSARERLEIALQSPSGA